MQFRKAHIPLVPRAGTYSCSSTNRLTRKKLASTQTDKCLSPFQNWFETNQILKDNLTFNEETTKTYSMALEYINSFHSYMNKKLSEKFDECGDSKPECNHCFKLPDVPNYAAVFLMLLEKTKETKVTGNSGYISKKKTDSVKPELETKKYATKETMVEFVPEIKKMFEYTILEQNDVLEDIKITDQEVQTAISRLKDDDSTSSPSKTVSDDFSASSSKKSSNLHSTLSEEGPDLDKENGLEEKVACRGKKADDILINGKIQKAGDEIIHKENNERNEELVTEQSHETQTDRKSFMGDVNKDLSLDDQSIMIDIIKERVRKEITTFLDKNSAPPPKNEQRPRLMRSHFNVVNIPPQINLLEYAQKKLERQLATGSRPVSPAGKADALENRRQFFNNCISARKSMNVTASTPKKVTDMFRKFSEENFRNVEDAFGLECEQSDEDSVILDDEEFEKINGYVDEQVDKRQKRNNSAGREKSNPLKLTVRDMTKVNEKMLSAIGLFTERGDIRPGVIDFLEEQNKAKPKDARNKQFRSRRQWDLQIHLNPKENLNSSLTSISSEKSFISLSSADLRSDFNTVKKVSQQVDYDE